MSSDFDPDAKKDEFALPDAQALGRAVARLARAARQAVARGEIEAPKPAPAAPLAAAPTVAAPTVPAPIVTAPFAPERLEAMELESRAAAAAEAEAAAAAAPGANLPPLEVQRMVEAVLFTAREPLSAQEIAALLPAGAAIGQALARLKQFYQSRGVYLAETAGKWRFQSAPDLAFLFQERAQAPKLGRAALETLAVIAYHQPVTRAEIEDVRGVSLARGTLDALLETGFVRPRGRRKAPGRPLTFGTTTFFLETFSLDSIEALPGREEMRLAGLLDLRLPADFLWPKPSAELAADEAPLSDSPEDPQFRLDFLGEGESEPDRPESGR